MWPRELGQLDAGRTTLTDGISPTDGADRPRVGATPVTVAVRREDPGQGPIPKSLKSEYGPTEAPGRAIQSGPSGPSATTRSGNPVHHGARVSLHQMATEGYPGNPTWFEDHYFHAAKEIVDFLAGDGLSLSGKRVADLGTGDGIIALGLFNSASPASLVAYDIEPVDTARCCNQRRRTELELPECPRAWPLRSPRTIGYRQAPEASTSLSRGPHSSTSASHWRWLVKYGAYWHPAASR